MPTIYNNADSNKRKTWFFLTGFFVLIILVGCVIKDNHGCKITEEKNEVKLLYTPEEYNRTYSDGDKYKILFPLQKSIDHWSVIPSEFETGMTAIYDKTKKEFIHSIIIHRRETVCPDINTGPAIDYWITSIENNLIIDFGQVFG
jgi:hypothetical protein